MSLAQGRPYLAIPGPSVIPDRVLNAMHRAAPNIYGGELADLVATLLPDLRLVARTNQNVALYISNGHGLWEAALANTLIPGEHVLVLATGFFANQWGDIAKRMGAKVSVLDFGGDQAICPDRVEAYLKTNDAQDIKAILCTHVDTGNSVLNDIANVRKAIDCARHSALLMVDCIASLACDDFHMDAWGVDVMISASQKGLMTPPGLGFVFFNDKAAQIQRKATMVTPYWDWVPRTAPEQFYQYFCGTAPTHHLFGLRAALTMLVHEEGLEAALHRHTVLARAVWRALEVWQEGGVVRPIIANQAKRSHAVTAVCAGAANGTALREWMVKNTNVTLGIGLGMAAWDDPEWHGHFRIAHMGYCNAHMILGMVACLDAGLKALAIPHGHGAGDAVAAICAQACVESKQDTLGG